VPSKSSTGALARAPIFIVDITDISSKVGRHRVLFGGDTAYTDVFRKIRSSKPLDLAIMPIGAYDPWIYAHCNPEQALAMANQAGAEFVLPVHHRTFKLSNEPYDEPIERLAGGGWFRGTIASP